MRRLLRVALLLLAVALVWPQVSSAKERPLVLWVDRGEGIEKRALSCSATCRLAARIWEARVAPQKGRWFCSGSAGAPAGGLTPFLAGAHWRGRPLARFVPRGACGRRQWAMISSVYYRFWSRDYFFRSP